ncbi:MAG TPA: enoyl-CoA hydratase/isomerase family protein [Candidatus Acidoferrum sp.]|nr:enoyl-CoA hydratase/isomerase family protein [Candidatus Acidoferrum sp.]
MVDSGYDDVLFRVERGLGWIRLNRPRAINALDHCMVRHIDAQLHDWAHDDAIAGVVLTGAGDRGLCAGGDIVSIYNDARTGGCDSIDFWRDEYLMNARIADYPKPYLAVMDGIVMGGGVGVAAHGSIRIVTERTMIAMPEVGIGFVPDVGGTRLLSRAPGELGTHLALTADRFGPGDAIATGFADHYLPTDRIPSLLDQLDGDTIQNGLAPLTCVAPDSPLERQRAWIDHCYAAASVTEIVERLRAHSDPAANKAADQISEKSPIAVCVTLRALRLARQLPTLRDVLDQELSISTTALDSHDLVEGIRAQVIDKDRTPHWSPPTLADVTPAMVERYFATVTFPGNEAASPREQVEK